MIFSLIHRVEAYFNPLMDHSAPSQVAYEEWSKPSRILQIRFITLLTGLLYIVFAFIENKILLHDALAFSRNIHLFFLPPILFAISAMSFNPKLYRLMILTLAIAPVLANIGNLYMVGLLRDSPIYLSEAYSSEVYLIIIWIFTLSGLRFAHAFISASVCFGITYIHQIYFPIPDEIVYLHLLWMATAFSFGAVSALIMEKNSRRIFASASRG